MPSRRPAVIALRRGRLIGGCAEDVDIVQAYHGGSSVRSARVPTCGMRSAECAKIRGMRSTCCSAPRRDRLSWHLPSAAAAATCESLTSLAGEERDRDARADGRAGSVHTAGWSSGWAGRRQCVCHARGVLPRRGDAQAGAAVGHQGGSVAAVERLERQAAGGRQRRVRRDDQLSRDGDGARVPATRPRAPTPGTQGHRATRSPTKTSSSTSRIARFTRPQSRRRRRSTGSTATRRGCPISPAARPADVRH